MKRAEAWEGDLAEFLKDYQYQRELTVHLDGLGSQPFAQERITLSISAPATMPRLISISVTSIDFSCSPSRTIEGKIREDDTRLAPVPDQHTPVCQLANSLNLGELFAQRRAWRPECRWRLRDAGLRDDAQRA